MDDDAWTMMRIRKRQRRDVVAFGQGRAVVVDGYVPIEEPTLRRSIRDDRPHENPFSKPAPMMMGYVRDQRVQRAK